MTRHTLDAGRDRERFFCLNQLHYHSHLAGFDHPQRQGEEGS